MIHMDMSEEAGRGGRQKALFDRPASSSVMELSRIPYSRRLHAHTGSSCLSDFVGKSKPDHDRQSFIALNNNKHLARREGVAAVR